ncbi:tyrosine-type recombinase/integrase [Phytopseudomonas argentinensis]|uniref:tyrosine-type recombinase/integrase n=1 Tax=Phytopseudomonas argentinensis TaxID=289370 RepID=UPI001FC9F604|nr:tyrosine-type recombinase/integrase [Pseudomonas argentinensis]
MDDIVVVNGIDCFHVRSAAHDQKIKTDSSERLIPIHSRLKALGFLEYVESQRQLGQARLFRELTLHKKHGYSAAPSKWFTRVRSQLGFEGKKDFHSFRHTLAAHLKQKGVAESLVGGILGHQTGGITFSRYGKEFKPESLLPVIEMIVYDVF